MAKFKVELPSDLIKEFEKLNKNTEEMMARMTEAGAGVVRQNIIKNVPKSLKNSNIMKCLKTTKVYKTPSDDGINTKVAFYGYFKNSKGKTVPAPLVANVFEYGSSKVNKQPFMRKSFKKAEITKAMLKAQERFLGKD